MSRITPHRIKLPINKVFISLLYRLTRLNSLAQKNTIVMVKNMMKIANPIILYLTDMIQVPIPLPLINTETRKLTMTVARNTRTKFFKGNFSKKDLNFFCFQKYRPRNPSNPMMIISFHIQSNFQNVPSNQSLKVTKVWRKNWRRSPMKNILATRVSVLIILFDGSMIP